MLTALLLTHALMSAPAMQDPDAELTKNLIPIGTKVPNFKVKDDSGKDFDLYKTFKNKKTKATILNFWFDT
ncbi:MAG: hypothetical protein IH945_09695 [Armatimonadetes bacterium]|nr:hypothetical protein [Armatimonadota bacterium]